ncbi:MAG: hypothetical protein ACREJC_02360 [Tepidisphaeraceae bacterium]
MRRDFTVHLRAEPDGPDRHGREPAYRLKLALKRLLRDHGLRCLSIAEKPPDAVESSPTARNRPHQSNGERRSAPDPTRDTLEIPARDRECFSTAPGLIQNILVSPSGTSPTPGRDRQKSRQRCAARVRPRWAGVRRGLTVTSGIETSTPAHEPERI